MLGFVYFLMVSLLFCVCVCVFFVNILDMCVGFDLAKVIKKKSTTNILTITAFIFVHRTFLNHA